MSWYDGIVSGASNAIGAIGSAVRVGAPSAPAISTPPTAPASTPVNGGGGISGFFSSLGDIIKRETSEMGTSLGRAVGSTIADSRKRAGAALANTPLGQQMQADYVQSILSDPFALVVIVLAGFLLLRGLSR